MGAARELYWKNLLSLSFSLASFVIGRRWNEKWAEKLKVGESERESEIASTSEKEEESSSYMREGGRGRHDDDDDDDWRDHL